MKYIYRSLFVYFAMIGAVALANLAPLPVTINAQSSSAPSVEVYRANARTLQFTVQDGVGSSATNLSLVGMTVRGYWFQSLRSTNVIQGTTSLIDGGSNGVVNIAFAAADLNHADGKYLYGVTIENGSGQIVTVNQGKFEIRPSPPVTGVSTSSFGQVINWNTYTSYTGNANAPVQPGSNITATTNSAGVVTFSTHATGETNIITSIVEGTAIDITTNGLGRTVSVDGTESFNASGATNLNGTSIASGTVADARIASSIARDSELTQVLAGTAIGVVTSGVNRTVSADLTQAVNGSGVTNLNGSNIASGTVADGRIASTIMRDSEGLLLTGGTMSGDINMGAGSFTNVAVIGLGAGDVTSFRSVAGNEIARITETFLRATKDMVVFEDFTVLQDSTLTGTLSVTGAVDISSTFTMLDDQWLGLGSAKGRIEFDDQATDEVNILGANVGIGTNAPAVALHVIGSARIAGDIQSSTDAGTYLQMTPSDIRLYSGSTLAFRLRNGTRYEMGDGSTDIYFNGNLGIGTNAPAVELEVVGDIRATQNGTNNCTLQYWAASNKWAMVQIINSQTNVTFVSP